MLCCYSRPQVSCIGVVLQLWHAKLKRTKFYSVGFLARYAKICTNENFTLYGIVPNLVTIPLPTQANLISVKGRATQVPSFENYRDDKLKSFYPMGTLPTHLIAKWSMDTGSVHNVAIITHSGQLTDTTQLLHSL